MTVDASIQEVDQRRNCTLEPDAPSSFDEMLDADAAKFRIMTDQVGQLAALLHQIAVRQACDAILEAAYPQQFAQNQTRVIETQRLIEIRSQ
jgi:hypothetical protein